jgi:hypothetical protein
MRWKGTLVYGSLALATALHATGAYAITQLTALTRSCLTVTAGTQCDFAPMESGPGASSSIDRPYGEFLTHAGLTVPDWDSFGANARASADYADPFGVFAQSVLGRTTARYRDTLTVGGGSGSGRVRFTWHIEGENDIAWTASPDITNVTAQVTLDFLCFAAPTQPCFSPHRAWTTSGVIDETITIDIPITFGVPSETFLEIDLAAAFGFATGNPCTGGCVTSLIGSVEGRFGATGTLTDVQIFDAGGGELDPSLIQSESGFRYDLVGLPEPSLAVLLGFVAAAASVRRARG